MKIILIVLLFFNNAVAGMINQASIIIYDYHLKRDGLWRIPAVSKSLKETAKIQLNLTLSGDVKGFEYQLKYQSQEQKPTLQTLFYIIDIDDNLSVQIGKFIENWQLGYAFNPLGLTDPYHPTNFDDTLNEKLGINAIVARYQLENISLDFYLSDDTKPRNNISGYGYKSSAMRLSYIVNDDVDISMIVHKNTDLNTGFGAGFQSIMGDNAKLYGSFFTRRGTAIPSISSKNRETNNNRYNQIMLGWQYTSNTNVGLIAEISQDDRGLNDAQYQILTVANLNLVRPSGIRQRYFFLRLGKIVDNHEFSLARRISEDKSALNILKWRYNFSENLQLDASYQKTTGTVGSEYKTYFPEQQESSLALRYSFNF